MRGPPHAGRPGGLVGLTRCLAICDGAARCWWLNSDAHTQLANNWHFNCDANEYRSANIVISTPPPDGWRARTDLDAQAAARRAPPITAHTPNAGVTSKQLSAFAQAQTATTTTHTYAACGRPRGRKQRATQDSPPTKGLAAQQAKSSVARRRGRHGGEQPRCARGNLKGRPKAWTKMTTGQSGAKAPDRNRGRSPPWRPRRRAAYEEAKPAKPNERSYFA